MKMKKVLLKFLLVFLLCDLVLTLSASGGQIRVGVADFIDRTNPTNPSVIPMRDITDMFIKNLSSCSSNIEVTVSKSFQALNGVTPESFADLGRNAGCQYVILGALTKEDTDLSYSYGKSGFLISIPTPKATIYTYTSTLDVRIIEVSTGKIIFSDSGSGKALYTQDIKEVYKNVHTAQGIQKDADDQIKMIKQSLSSASSMAAEKICAFLTGEYPEISSIQHKEKENIKTAKKSKSARTTRKSKKTEETPGLGTVTINRGTLSGINDKTFYRIFFEGKEVFDFSGNSLGREKFNIAVAEVKSVKTDYSTASVIGGIFSNIRGGDKAEQVTQEEAQSIIERNDFVKNRFSEFLE